MTVPTVLANVVVRAGTRDDRGNAYIGETIVQDPLNIMVEHCKRPDSVIAAAHQQARDMSLRYGMGAVIFERYRTSQAVVEGFSIYALYIDGRLATSAGEKNIVDRLLAVDALHRPTTNHGAF